MQDIKRDIPPLSNLKRNTVPFLQQLRETGQPIVLTINGKAELVVQDVQSYQKLLELVDRLETIESIRAGMKDIEEGQSLSLDQFKDEVRKKHGIPL